MDAACIALARMGKHGIAPAHDTTVRSLVDFTAERLPQQLHGKNSLLSLVNGVCKLVRQVATAEMRQELRRLLREQVEPLVFRKALDSQFTVGDISTLVFSFAMAAERIPRLMSVFDDLYVENYDEFSIREAVKLISGKNAFHLWERPSF